jgi:hypothetical protein
MSDQIFDAAAIGDEGGDAAFTSDDLYGPSRWGRFELYLTEFYLSDIGENGA